MTELFIILKDIVLPVFVMIAIGYALQKKHNMDLKTLTKLNIYCFVPGFIFITLYNSDFTARLFIEVFIFFVLLVAVLHFMVLFLSKAINLSKNEKTTLSNSAMFFNAGNYGVPVNDLVFKGDPYAMSVQVVLMTLQNLFIFSYGIFSLQAIKISKSQAVLNYFRMPLIYALLAGVLLNYFKVPLPELIIIPSTYIGDAMISLALLTLGAQVAKLKFMKQLSSIYLSLIIRLIIGPLVSLGIIFLFDINGTIAQVLFIASAMPTSVNSAVIAEEYDNQPQLAAQIVLFSTIISAVTVTIVIYLSNFLA
ncbi:AEC family transporter [Alkalicoccus daliensis]|uniref:AEC family transporter n=1 Tax=Alkalicoccus daliensis TaxID=745820 RepID=A0A1H0EYA4_9BACI|nr:AEC family transporter [Alkalicoccus daliensis]SDN87286.1 hypothetical protein SAMN04488053_104116 [Alkalicoccus daliensis]